MCAMRQLDLFGPSTSSAAASPVRTSASRAQAPASGGGGRASGPSSRASSESFDLRRSSSRTSPSSAAGDSTSCSVTLPRAGTMRRGIAFPQPPSAPLTAVTGSSWSRGEYPTPTASRYGSGQNGTKNGRPFNNAGMPSLDTWAARMWPTPSATDWKGSSRLGQRRGQLSEAVLWPTPTVSDCKGGAKFGQANVKSQSAHGLAATAAMWPTPTRSDASDSRRHGHMLSGHPGTTLLDAASSRLDMPTPPAGTRTAWPVVLNPRFVEALMGFPDGWTSVDLPLSATQSSRKSRKQSGESR